MRGEPEVEEHCEDGEDVELERFGDELGEGEVADGPIDVAEKRDDIGQVGGCDEVKGGEEGEASSD